MKSIILYILVFVSGIIVSAQNPVPQWERVWHPRGDGYDYGMDVATDADNNVILGGYFKSSTLSIGPIMNQTNLSNEGSYDGFVSRYDSSGAFRWAKSIGSDTYDYVKSVCADDSGNVYILGYSYADSLTFGEETLYNSGSADLFLVKYSEDGNIMWANKIAGDAADYAGQLTIDSYGYIYISGYFYSSYLTFGTKSVSNSASSSSDIFVGKCDTSGNVLWLKSWGGDGYDKPNEIKVDPIGYVYLAGYSNSTTLILGSTAITNEGSYDGFVLKLDPNGTEVWATGFQGDSYDYLSGIAFDNSSNVYLSGYFKSSSVKFGTTTLLNQGGSYDGFLVKLNSSGTYIWDIVLDGDSSDYAKFLVNDKDDNIYWGGYFYSSELHFDTDTILNSGSSADVFVSKFDKDGNNLWVTYAGGSDYDNMYSMTASNWGHIYATGIFASSTFETADSLSISNEGDYDVWLGDISEWTPLDSTTIDTTVIDTTVTDTNIVDTTSGIWSYSDINNQVKIYPTPAQEEVFVEFDNEIENVPVIVYDLQGMLVRKEYFSEKINIINISDLPNGIYIMRIEGIGQTYIQKR